jgi:chitodextrinase
VIAKKVADARAERNRLLSETDWTQAKDVPDSVSTKWAPYRQALRDVPQQAGFPDNIQWPSKPE